MSKVARLSMIVLFTLMAVAVGYISLDKRIASAEALTIAQGNPYGPRHEPYGGPPPHQRVGPPPSVYLIGSNPVQGGFGIYRWSGRDWDTIPGGGSDITVDSDGTPWMVNAKHEIYRLDGSRWNHIAGSAMDIAACHGQVYVIGTDPVQGGYGIHRWNGRGWTSIEGGGVRIAVGPEGMPWVVNSNNNIFQFSNGKWIEKTGSATDIGGGSNQIWVIGTNPLPGGYGIYRLKGGRWDPVTGSGVRIDVDSRGAAWVVNASGEIYHWEGSAFDKLPGNAKDIGAE